MKKKQAKRSPTKTKRLRTSDYEALVEKVDAFFGRVQTRYAAQMRCGAGCSDCCQSHLSISPIEEQVLRDHVRALPAAERARLAARAEALRGTEGPCPALDADGRCAVYDARPIVCRTHGVPMRVPSKGSLRIVDGDVKSEGTLAVCHLNFNELPLTSVDEECVLDLTTVSTLLGLLNARQGKELLSRRTRIGDVLFSAHRD